jgi:hypothetical protein
VTASEELLRYFAAMEMAARPPGETFEQRLLHAFGPMSELRGGKTLALRDALRADIAGERG